MIHNLEGEFVVIVSYTEHISLQYINSLVVCMEIHVRLCIPILMYIIGNTCHEHNMLFFACQTQHQND